MRVVHLATVDTEGGAARSAFRLHQGLLAAGVESSMLVRQKLSAEPTVREAPGLEPVEAFCWELVRNYWLGPNRTSVSNTYFSLGQPGLDLSTHEAVQRADVVHVHWVAGYQSARTLARIASLQKPLVWTLHDQRPFTGGCHFSAGCVQYENDCSACPQLEPAAHGLPHAALADALSAFAGGPFTIAAPSRWLSACARSSAVFRGLRVETIPYGVDVATFRPRSQAEARRAAGLTEGGLVVLLGSDYGLEKRKGYAELARALRLCLKHPALSEKRRRGELHFAAFGRPSPDLADIVHPLGYIDSDARLASVYAGADLFLLPSLEDNLPNTALESMACGTPVMAFNVGGLPDLVEDNATGRLVSPVSAEALGTALASWAMEPPQQQSWREACRKRIEARFTLELQAQRYAELYRQLLSKPLPELAGGKNNANAHEQLDDVLPHLLLLALPRFAKDIKMASSAQRQTCRELVRALEQQCAGALATSERTRIQQLEQALMVQETEREQRRAAYRARKAAWKTRLSRALGFSRKTPAAAD